MQGERASLGSLSEALNFEHGSTSSNAVIDQQIRWEDIHNLGDNDMHDYMSSAADTNPTFGNSVYHEQRDLHRLNIGEGSSSGTKNEAASHTEQWMNIGQFEERRNGKLELNPMFVQPSSGNRVVRNVNLNAEYNEHLEDMNPVTGLFEVNGLGSGLLPENSVRAGSSVDGRRTSCKRKALDASIGQSSSSGGGFREFQRGESSSWISTPTYYNPNDLNISLDHGPRGLVSGSIPIRSAPATTESSSRNYSVVRVNPTAQQQTVNPSVFAAGTVIRRPVVPSFNSPGLLLPADQQLMDLRYGHALGSFASQNPNGPATHMPPVSRNTFQWSGTPVAAVGVSLSSATPVDRNVIHRDETRQRSNILDIPFFVPAVPQLRNLPHGHISRNVSGAGHIASSSSRTSVQPSSSSPAWTPYQNNSPNNQRRLSEHFRRSLLSSLATNQRAARPLVPPASPDEHVLQSGGVNTSQVQNRAYSRAGPRQVQNATGVTHPLRGLASTSRGRSRMAASEIRSVLDHMRRGGNLRFEDVMLLNQSMVLGGADIHDRYRDMRLDVDNMTYEELLSLEERIGDVCTGLNEEIISNRLKQQKYKSNIKSSQEVEPCCICQEEYKEGEEMGKLECGHDFHSQCIKEWLKMKNLCPICKTTGLNTTELPRRG
ncbi:putative E3 ubiquitin-protein ligase RHG1A [Cardamine amara subsp. amara]|uniref:RING-type E3 ubiquitin transferase n=1 Tax=Cardamine amara subsp. amara TaxID=228776 RepID=A0ABD1ALU8_CARAN